MLLPADANPPCQQNRPRWDDTDPREQAAARSECATCPILKNCRAIWDDMKTYDQRQFTGTIAGRSQRWSHGLIVADIFGPSNKAATSQCRLCGAIYERGSEGSTSRHCAPCRIEVRRATWRRAEDRKRAKKAESRSRAA